VTRIRIVAEPVGRLEKLRQELGLSQDSPKYSAHDKEQRILETRGWGGKRGEGRDFFLERGVVY